MVSTSGHKIAFIAFALEGRNSSSAAGSSATLAVTVDVAAAAVLRLYSRIRK